MEVEDDDPMGIFMKPGDYPELESEHESTNDDDDDDDDDD